ncbi:MAG: hypothetical protein OXE87_01730 [Chloroflexi bacterium]|nr:hypothetical protein [Chloroflexota bacterium]
MIIAVKPRQLTIALAAAICAALALTVAGLLFVRPSITNATDDASAKQIAISRCSDTEISIEHARVERDNVILEWSEVYHGPHDWSESYETIYRIDRAHAYDHERWEEVASVRDAFSWSSPTLPGEWYFRVGVVAAVIEGETLTCLDNEVSWGTEYVNVDRPLTAAEWQAFAIDLCANVTVFDMAGWFERDMVHLDWWVDDNYLYETGYYYNEHYEDYVLGYRIEKRKIDDGSSWQYVADLVDERWWKGGPGEAGAWEYRVALVLVRRESQSVSCGGDPTWATVEVQVPTAEDIAHEKAQREILVAEMLRCQVESLTANISDEARPIIVAQIEKMTREQVEYVDGLEELVQLTLISCATSGDQEMGAWITLLMWGSLF